MAALFREFPLLNLKTDMRAFSTPILTDGESTYLFYLANNRTGIYGDLPEAIGKTFKIRWFDPLTGQSYDGGQKTLHSDTWGAWLGGQRHKEITGASAIAIFTQIRGN
ncbi:MAG: hypothetical protein CMO80_02020 [Verrucomicrobiales bacterium]|nr:hypothetical protein [Verrucomicrobiales bacterium]|tara:strand:+ start:5047 stop:5370 length:324 start_codon:yes stop_codon:yes gene_type:complete